MSFVADLHTHSPFSRATSADCTLEKLHVWAQIKGVRVVGTGDFTHPERIKEIREKLEPSLAGLYRLKPELAAAADAEVPQKCRAPVEFMITGEISSIYKREGVCRKVHSLLLMPDMASAEALNARLARLGNIVSDGRPILGLDPRTLLEMMLEISGECCLIPAHIWTPWFSMLGSKSGFDSPEECFGELLPHVFAVETGLSSDPPMNWRVAALDSFCLVSNSDLHSPANLARNANVFHCEPDYFSIIKALRTRAPAAAGGTIDMFPEEGKYHCDGHRKCGVCLMPEESMALENMCPKCGKPLVLGVLHRVAELADRPAGFRPPGALPCEHIIPLPELLSEILGSPSNSRRVTEACDRFVRRFGPELFILRQAAFEDIEKSEVPLLAEALRRVRTENVIKKPGYDGEYGVIRVFAEGEKEKLAGQAALFTFSRGSKPAAERAKKAVSRKKNAGAYPAAEQSEAEAAAVRERADNLTPEQAAAAAETAVPVIISAGPGSGKTRTLTARIAQLVAAGEQPGSILAVTFTNRAAAEMRARLERVLGGKAKWLHICTFHSFCLGLLRKFPEQAAVPPDFLVIDQLEELELLRKTAGVAPERAAWMAETLEKSRRALEPLPPEHEFGLLQLALREQRLLPLDEIVPACVRLLQDNPDILAGLGLKWICVDEYQDVNRAQYELIRILAAEGKGLCVIGDPDQAIYGFRGSDAAFFLNFTRDFPAARRFALKVNFRSTAQIAEAANRVMASGRTEMSAEPVATNAAGPLVFFHAAETAAAEAEFIAHEIEKLLGGAGFFSMDSGRVEAQADGLHFGMNEIAVLVRLRALIPPLAEALEALGLPVQVVGDENFASLPGASAILRVLRRCQRDVLAMPAAAALERAAPRVPIDAATAAALAECRALAAGFHGTLREFIDVLMLRKEPDRYDKNAERISILTFHAAKGLEFPAVFLAGCDDGIVPYVPHAAGARPADMAEERRLLYVAMTRAMKLLYVCSARKRILFGETVHLSQSRFLKEIGPEWRMEIRSRPLKRKDKPRQLEFDF